MYQPVQAKELGRRPKAARSDGRTVRPSTGYWADNYT